MTGNKCGNDQCNFFVHPMPKMFDSHGTTLTGVLHHPSLTAHMLGHEDIKFTILLKSLVFGHHFRIVPPKP